MINILIVEDSRSARMLLEEILGSDPGIKIIGSVDSGEAAIDLAQSELPDLILMDIRLREGIDGIEATRRLKNLPSITQIPVVAITASVSPEDIQRALEAGCRGFIRKPIDIDEFPEQVTKYLAR